MNEYLDQFGRLHSKPLRRNDPLPTNNAWLDSLIAEKFGVPMNINKDALLDCMKNKTRHPFNLKPTVPLSRDEMLAFYYFHSKMGGELDETFNMSVEPIPERSYSKTIASLILCIGEHRNYYHETKLRYMYWLAHTLPVHDRAFAYRCYGRKVPVFYKLIEYLDKTFVKPKNKSSMIIRFAKYDKFYGVQPFIDQYGELHPLSKAAKKHIE